MPATKTRREELETLVADLKGFDEATASGEEIAAADQKAARVRELVTELKGSSERGRIVNAAGQFLDVLEGKGAGDGELEFHDGVVNPTGMTLGEAFAKSPAYAEFVDQYRGRDGAIMSVQGVKTRAFELEAGFEDWTKGVEASGLKDLVTGASSTSGGAFVQNLRLAGLTDLIGDRELTVRDLCTVIPITSDTFEYVRVTGKTNNAAAVAEATSAADIGDGTGGTVLPAAGGRKPESALTFEVVNSPVETIAHLIPITRRAAADAPQVRAIVDAFLLQGLREEEEDQILNGNGTSPNLRGILQTAGISTVGSAGTDIDAVVDAIRTIRADRRRPTAMVIHPNDWYTTGFLLAKDSTGRYLLGDPRASVDQLMTLWGLRVVVTEAMTENTALVGDFRQAVFADRQQGAIYVTDSHKDWFQRNLLAILAEERAGFGVLDPDAFCTITAV